MSTFVIGDIHGELEQLKTLIQKINLNDEDEPELFTEQYLNQ